MMKDREKPTMPFIVIRILNLLPQSFSIPRKEAVIIGQPHGDKRTALKKNRKNRNQVGVNKLLSKSGQDSANRASYVCH